MGNPIKNYDFEYSTSVEWGNPLVRVISISDTIDSNSIVLQVESEKELLTSTLDSNYLFLELKTNKVVIGNEFLENFIILEFESENNTQFLFFRNGPSLCLIVGNGNIDLLSLGQGFYNDNYAL